VSEKLTELKLKIVDEMPSPIEPGVLYVSQNHKLGIHLCPCGCGTHSVTPFKGPKAWGLKIEGDIATISPSLQNTAECKSHYFIEKNKIRRV